jgi:hypothetical protein
MDLFEKEYKMWMDVHIAKRKGERRRKLAEGNNHAENRAIKLKDLERLFSFRYRAARTVIDRLVAKQWLVTAGGGKDRIHSWEVNVNNKQLPL